MTEKNEIRSLKDLPSRTHHFLQFQEEFGILHVFFNPHPNMRDMQVAVSPDRLANGILRFSPRRKGRRHEPNQRMAHAREISPEGEEGEEAHVEDTRAERERSKTQEVVNSWKFKRTFKEWHVEASGSTKRMDGYSQKVNICNVTLPLPGRGHLSSRNGVLPRLTCIMQSCCEICRCVQIEAVQRWPVPVIAVGRRGSPVCPVFSFGMIGCLWGPNSI